MALLIPGLVCSQNPFWVNADKKLINKLANQYSENPNYLSSIYGIHENNFDSLDYEDLGFGYKMIKKGLGGGYISLKTNFYFHQDSLIGFTIFLSLPDHKRLIEKYKEWYKDKFNLEEYSPKIYYNSELMDYPLLGYYGTLNVQEIRKELKFYFSIESGLMYGLRGGYSNSILPNRKLFIGLLNSLTYEELYLLMHSKNPATRLTAIEYYLRNKSNIDLEYPVDEWIEKVLRQTTSVDTLDGCLGSRRDPRLVLWPLVGMAESPYEK